MGEEREKRDYARRSVAVISRTVRYPVGNRQSESIIHPKPFFHPSVPSYYQILPNSPFAAFAARPTSVGLDGASVSLPDVTDSPLAVRSRFAGCVNVAVVGLAGVGYMRFGLELFVEEGTVGGTADVGDVGAG